MLAAVLTKDKLHRITSNISLKLATHVIRVVIEYINLQMFLLLETVADKWSKPSYPPTTV